MLFFKIRDLKALRIVIFEVAEVCFNNSQPKITPCILLGKSFLIVN